MQTVEMDGDNDYLERVECLLQDQELEMFSDSSFASRQERYREIIVTLIHSGALPNLVYTGWRTPLHYAARLCDSLLVSTLLQNWADKSLKDKNKKRAFDLAHEKGCTSVEALLKE